MLGDRVHGDTGIPHGSMDAYSAHGVHCKVASVYCEPDALNSDARYRLLNRCLLRGSRARILLA